MHRFKALRANPGRATQPRENNAHSAHRVPGTIGKRTSLNKVKLTMLQHPARRLGIFFLLWLIYPLPLSATQSDDATLKFITIDVAQIGRASCRETEANTIAGEAQNRK